MEGGLGVFGGVEAWGEFRGGCVWRLHGVMGCVGVGPLGLVWS